MLLLKFLHLLAVAGFCGGIAAQIVLARIASGADGQSIVPTLERLLTGPSLLLQIVTGMLLLALRPGYLEQRWVWAKLLLTMVIAPVAWFGAGVNAMALALGLALAAAAVAVWRPRWGAPPPR